MAQDTATFWNATAGLTTLVLAVTASDGQIINASTGALMALSAANIPNAAVAMSDAGHANYYQAAYPPANTPAGRYAVAVYQKAGANLALSDAPVSESFGFAWDGTSVVPDETAVDLTIAKLAAMIATPGGVPQWSGTSLQQMVPILLDADRTTHTAPNSVGEGLNAAVGSSTGDGDTPVDHNYGGTDALRVLESGVPVDDATIRAYVAADYDAGTFAAKPPTTFTGSDGRWTAPLMLDPDAYVLVVSKANAIVTKIVRLTVT